MFAQKHSTLSQEEPKPFQPWEPKATTLCSGSHTNPLSPNPSAQPHAHRVAVCSSFISKRRDEKGREGRDEIMTQICSCKLPRSPLGEGKRSSGIQVSHSLTRSCRAF